MKINYMEECKKIHNNKYDYSLSEFKNMHDKIKIICPIHGAFEQNLYTHLNNSGCQKCGKKINDTEDFIKKSKETHKDKYNYYDTIYSGFKNKVKIECQKHGFFYQYPAHHIQGCGCPKCKISKGEESIEKYLIENNIIYKTQKTFKKCKYKYVLRFDFYLPYYNICIEYDGKQHYTSVKYWGGENGLKTQIIKDDIKTEYCKNNNINLLRIKYNENILDILQKLFL